MSWCCATTCGGLVSRSVMVRWWCNLLRWWCVIGGRGGAYCGLVAGVLCGFMVSVCVVLVCLHGVVFCGGGDGVVVWSLWCCMWCAEARSTYWCVVCGVCVYLVWCSGVCVCACCVAGCCGVWCTCVIW